MRAIFTGAGSGWAFGEGGAYLYHATTPAQLDSVAGPDSLSPAGRNVSLTKTAAGWSARDQPFCKLRTAAKPGISSQLPNIPMCDSIQLLSSMRVWVGPSEVAAAIYRTINGGHSWQAQASGVTADLLDVKFLDAVEGWAVGDEGTVYIRSTAAFVGPESAAALRTRSNASSSPIALMAGPWALAGRSSPMRHLARLRTNSPRLRRY